MKGLKFAGMFLSLISLTYGVEQEIDIRETPWAMGQKEQSVSVSPDPLSVVEKITDQDVSHQATAPHLLKRILNSPYTQASISLGLLAGFGVGGYFLMNHVNQVLLDKYAYPRFAPDGYAWGSSCMQIQSSCTCYRRSISPDLPLDYGLIPQFLWSIQQSCSLPQNALQRMGDHINSTWDDFNRGGTNNYYSAQCQNDYSVRDAVTIAYKPGRRIHDRYLLGYTFLMIEVANYTAQCVAQNDPMFGGTIVGWGFAFAFTLCFQWVTYGCYVNYLS